MLLSLNKEKLLNCIKNMFNFNIYDTVYYINKFDKKNLKLACFDLDHTLIKPIGNRKLPKDSNDYEYIKNVKETLVKLKDDNYHIIIFSNQSGSKLEQVLIKIKNILFELSNLNQLRISVFIATKDNYYRKPHTGMFELFLKLNDIQISDLKEVFYCGDAAGRKGDFACSDYSFFNNLSLKYFNKLDNKQNKILFYVPEELFMNQKVNYIPICKDNSQIFINEYYEKYDEITKNLTIPIPTKEQEIIIICGLPGSGKSKLAYDIYGQLDNYIIVSKDVYKTRSITVIKQSLKKNLSVVVDDTNVDIKNRDIYIKLAKENDIPIKCVHLNTYLNLCKHLNDMRVEIGKGDIIKVPDIVYNVLNKKYSRPELKEGFQEIYTIPFLLPNKQNINLIPKEFYYIYNTLII